MQKKLDFLKGPVWRCIVAQAIPLAVGQLVQLLYNVVGRIYLGHMGDGNGMALTGVGLTFPVITLIMAVTALFGVLGVFMAEPVSNVIGGLASYITMRMTVYKQVGNAIKTGSAQKSAD